MTLEAELGAALTEARGRAPFQSICVAVSGGGDSLALLHMAAGWASAQGMPVHAVTVDHGLRTEAAAEAAHVAALCETLDVSHAILRWEGWDGQGNLMATARAARYDLIAAQTARLGADTPILLAHTAEDQAETFLMRLARGSGPDGLSSMRRDWKDRGRRWLRPCLGMARDSLRGYLRDREISWIDDPTNDDESFGRVRIRKARALLDDLGLTVPRLTATAGRMEAASEVLRRFAHDAATRIATVEAGDVVFDAPGLAALPAETRERLLAHALRWVTSAAYRPRHAALSGALQDLEGGGTATLAGCLLTVKAGRLRVTREAKAVAQEVGGPDDVWDGRWQITAPKGLDTQGFEIRMLGEDGLRLCPEWRDTGLPRPSLLSTPAIWSDGRLVAAPLAGASDNWVAKIVHPWGDFQTSLLSH